MSKFPSLESRFIVCSGCAVVDDVNCPFDKDSLSPPKAEELNDDVELKDEEPEFIDEPELNKEPEFNEKSEFDEELELNEESGLKDVPAFNEDSELDDEPKPHELEPELNEDDELSDKDPICWPSEAPSEVAPCWPAISVCIGVTSPVENSLRFPDCVELIFDPRSVLKSNSCVRKCFWPIFEWCVLFDLCPTTFPCI